jgi:inosine-uridine nucleoside N-ribohydrolase
MARKVIIVADPGIDGAFAIALALHDPKLEVLCLVATAGNVPAERATRNVHIIVEQTDPPRWPRFGAALPVEYEVDGTKLHGSTGLGGLEFPCAELHHMHSGDRLIVDLVRQYPKEVSIVMMGPLTVLARAFDRDPELPSLVDQVICLGGAWHDSGNATAVSEFHFFCDPEAAQQVLRSGVHLMLIPLDVSRKLLFSPTDLLELPGPFSQTSQFLRQIIPHGIGATASLYGVEGFHLKDVLGVAALCVPDAITSKPMVVHVETRGLLTRGMSVVDTRWMCQDKPNVDLATSVDLAIVRHYISSVLENT